MEVDTTYFPLSFMLCFCLIVFCSLSITYVCTKPGVMSTDCVQCVRIYKPNVMMLPYNNNIGTVLYQNKFNNHDSM